MTSEYNWIITKDYIGEGEENGITGPYDKSNHTDNETEFRMYDDDGFCIIRVKYGVILTGLNH